MTRRRWIADEVKGDTASLLGEHAAHLVRVLRAKVGQQFDIVVSPEAKEHEPSDVRRGTITAISESRVDFSLGEMVPQATAAIPQITLLLAIFKFDRMEWAIEKCTEIGVSRVIPLIARRSDSHLVAAASKRHERWLRLARQASEQSRRVSPPEIMLPTKLKDCDGSLHRSSVGIVLSEALDSGSRRLAEVVSAQSAGVALAVGPEGGWSEDELEWFQQKGWMAASLGGTILRAETAAIVATALAMEALR
jgi:16S rRNA (uracil1498-N3)-methyltransferase